MKLFWKIVLVFTCIAANCQDSRAIGNEVDPGQTTFRENFSTDQNERIDPYTGELNLVYTDLRLPGKGGHDLVINRTYNSSRPKNIEKTLLGVGWDIHFGRLRIDKPKVSIELQDGTVNQATKEQIDSNLQITYDYVTKDFWRVDAQGTPNRVLKNS